MNPDASVPLTGEQEATLRSKNVSVAVGAGAGTGKTRVLTECFVRRLEGADRLGLGQIVALTFTEKAARQLRDRVRAVCRERLARNEDPAYWRSVLIGLEAAPIGTFHAFCARLLRRFSLEAGIEPGFRVLEETVAPSLRERVLSRCVRNWLITENPDFLTLAVEFGVTGTRERLCDLLAARTRGDLAAWLGSSPEAIVAHWEDHWRNQGLRELLDLLVERSRPTLDLLRDQPCSRPVMRDRIHTLLEGLTNLDRRPDLPAALQALLDAARVQGTSAADWPDRDFYERVKSALEQLRAEIKRVFERNKWDPVVSLEAAGIGLRFARLTNEAIEHLDRVKREQGLLDFDDLLLRTRALLAQGDPAIRHWIKHRIAFIIIDEFQDTDPIQDEILRDLAGPDWMQGRLFLVGDTKQSIYRFRGAQPDLFERYRADLAPLGRWALSHNFRSVPNILHFVNALFESTFHGPDNALRAPESVHSGQDGPAVEFLWASDASWRNLDRISVDERRRVEARWIARLITSRLNEGAWLVRGEDEKHTLRPAQPGDIVILFRTLNDSAVYESALAEAGLDYHVTGGASFYGQQEVLDIINLLSVLEDPHDAVALAATLRSPFGCVSDNGLYWLGTSCAGGLLAGFRQIERIDDLSEEDRVQVLRLRDRIAHWRAIKDRVAIAVLLDTILDQSGFEAALLAEHLGERRRANVRKLVRLARTFDLQRHFTLADFVARLRADWRTPPREDQAVTTDEESNAVRLMTIHQAKGLEFPVVILADLDRFQQVPAGREDIVFDPTLGFVFKGLREDTGPGPDEPGDTNSKNNCLGWALYATLEKRAERDEALRLFYVATTRARDHLILAAGLEPAEPPHSTALQLLDARFDRATGAVRQPVSSESTPAVSVVATEPQAPVVRRRHRPRLNRLSRMIRRTPLEPAAFESPTEKRALPGFVDLDSTAGLTPFSARVAQLIRAYLAHPEALRTSRFRSLLHRLAGLQNPVATRRVEHAARDLIAPWLESEYGDILRRAAAVRRAVPWSLVGPSPLDCSSTVFRGRTEFLFRTEDDPGAEWTIWHLAHPEADRDHEALRLLLGASAAATNNGALARTGFLFGLGSSPELTEFDLRADSVRDTLTRILASGWPSPPAC